MEWTNLVETLETHSGSGVRVQVFAEQSDDELAVEIATFGGVLQIDRSQDLGGEEVLSCRVGAALLVLAENLSEPHLQESELVVLVPGARIYIEAGANAPCNDCGKDTLPPVGPAEYYAVTDEVWAKAGLGKGLLCIECLETRLGRSLTPADFTDAPINDPAAIDSALLARRKRDRTSTPFASSWWRRSDGRVIWVPGTKPA